MSDQDDKDSDLTLRDKFAMAALPPIVELFNYIGPESVAIMAYKIADAMLKARLTALPEKNNESI